MSSHWAFMGINHTASTHTHTKLLLSRKLKHIVTENVDSTYFDIMNHTVSAELPVSLLQDS